MNLIGLGDCVGVVRGPDKFGVEFWNYKTGMSREIELTMPQDEQSQHPFEWKQFSFLLIANGNAAILVREGEQNTSVGIETFSSTKHIVDCLKFAMPSGRMEWRKAMGEYICRPCAIE